MKAPLIAATAFLILQTLGCNTSFQQVQSTYLPHDHTRPYEVYPRVTGKACEYRILGVIPIGDAGVNEAIADMTKGSDKIDNLFGVQVETDWSFWLLGVSSCTVVSAYPVLYRDARAKLGVFAPDYMAGRLTRKPVVSSPSGTPVVESLDNVSVPVSAKNPEVPNVPKNNTPPVQPNKGTTEPVKVVNAESPPTQAQCEGKCATFSALWKGSDAIKTTIRGQCMKKCLRPDNKEYRNCIEKASTVEDISKCNAME